MFWWLVYSSITFFFLSYFVKPLNNLMTLFLRLNEGLAGRDYFWDLSINIIKENPWFGMGPGAYKYEMYNYFPVLLDSWKGAVLTEVHAVTGGSNASHNFFLLFFSDMGILGLFSSILLFVLIYSIGIPLLKVFKNKNELNYIITLSVLAIGSGLFIRAFFENIGLITYGYITVDLPFWICFAIIIHFY